MAKPAELRERGIEPIRLAQHEKPRCKCGKIAQHMGSYRLTSEPPGMPAYRKNGDGEYVCTKCHSMKYGIGGWAYKQYRKDYCENVDGRLGFVCTSTIIDPTWQLDADHIDGNHDNNAEENIQTLCACCHRIKTKLFEDWATPSKPN